MLGVQCVWQVSLFVYFSGLAKCLDLLCFRCVFWSKHHGRLLSFTAGARAKIVGLIGIVDCTYICVFFSFVCIIECTYVYVCFFAYTVVCIVDVSRTCICCHRWRTHVCVLFVWRGPHWTLGPDPIDGTPRWHTMLVRPISRSPTLTSWWGIRGTTLRVILLEILRQRLG